MLTFWILASLTAVCNAYDRFGEQLVQKYLADERPLSRNLLNFLTMASGEFSFDLLVDAGTLFRAESYINHLISRQVDIPSLRPAITFYIEEEDEGKLTSMYVVLFREDPDQTIRYIGYPVKNFEDYRPGEFVKYHLDNFTLDDTGHENKVKGVYLNVEDSLYLGFITRCSRNECRDVASSLSCKGFGYLPTSGERFRPSYQRRVGNRYPLLPQTLSGNEDFISVCDQ